MNFFDELKVADCITSQGRAEVFGEMFELAEVIAKFDSRDIVDYVQKSHTCTRVVRSLAYISYVFFG